MKAVYRGVLVVPRVPPLVDQSDVDLWDHSKPILSVVIPCHNYGQYIREALRSLALQTFRDFETIIVDDGSSDKGTLDILDDLREEGLQVLRQEKLNVAAALNHGILVARGRYVCCFAADDKLEPTYFEKCLCLLESNPGLAFVYSLVRTFGDENQVWLTEPFDLRMLLEYNHICATAVFRRIAWENVGGFDTLMDGYEDWDFWIKAGKVGFRGRLIPEILFNYRRHGITLNLRSDKRSQKLIDHIRANHVELYSRPEQIKEIQNGYCDIRIPQPFLNLSLKEQYNLKKTAVIVASLQGAKAVNRFLIQSSLKSNDPNSMHFILISTDDISYQQDGSLQEVSDQAYFLPRFLDSHYWLNFVLNAIETRSAKFVVLSGSQFAYEITPVLRSRTTAVIVHVIQDESQCRMSAELDEFIDFHVTFSEHASKSLTRDFMIPERKIYSLSKPASFGEARNELLEALRVLG